MLPRISACLIVRNEEANLERCLKSVAALVDEIVVVDTGSTDRTVDIARAHAARIGSFVWVNDFAAARNAALDLATGDWVLSIDADEWLAPGAPDFVRRELARATAADIFAPYVVMTDGTGSYTNGRLFVREGSRWEFRIHEQIRIAHPQPRGIHAEAFRLMHGGYTAEVMPAKESRNLPLLQAMLSESAPGSREWRHATIYLARTRMRPFSAEDEAAVEAAILACVGYDATSMHLLTYRLYRHWIEAGRFDQVEQANGRLKTSGVTGPLIELATAISHLEAGDPTLAKAALSRAESAPDHVHARNMMRGMFESLRQLMRGG